MNDECLCPMDRASSVVGDRWSLLIMRNALLGMRRFDAFRAGLGIADNVLAGRLRKLVDAGLLTRVPYSDGGRVREEYLLTEAGADLHVVLEALGAWGHKHAPTPASPAPPGVVHRPCGGLTGPGEVCTTCGAPLDVADLAWLMPWLAPEPVPLASGGGREGQPQR